MTSFPTDLTQLAEQPRPSMTNPFMIPVATNAAVRARVARAVGPDIVGTEHLAATGVTLRDLSSKELGEVSITRLAPAPVPFPRINRLEATALKVFSKVPDLANYPSGAIRSLVRTAHDPVQLMARIADSVDLESTVDGEVVTISTRTRANGLLFLHQPRKKGQGRVYDVQDPRIDSLPDGTTTLVYRNPQHLHDQQREIITRSLPGGIKAERHVQIAESGVRRKVLAEMVLITFTDGSPDQWVLMVRDGMTRTSVALAFQLGLLGSQSEKSAAEASQKIADYLVPVEKVRRARSSKAIVEWSAVGHDALAKRYAGMCDPLEGPSAQAMLLQQFATIPVTVVLRAFNGDRLGRVRDAMKSLVADQHTGTEKWHEDDEAIYNVERALEMLAEIGALDPGEADLWLGRRPMSDVDVLFPPPTDADPARVGVRFLVQLFARLLSPEVYEALKRCLRRTSGGRFTYARVVESLAPLANQHWVGRKPLGRLWSYGGGAALEGTLRGVGLALRAPIDYLDLVEDAVAGDEHARTELALAGGGAMLADGVLTTRVVGGSGGSKALPFRGAVPELFRLLCSTREGLVQLAVAANAFDPAQPASSARLPKGDLNNSAGGFVERDTAGVRVAVLEEDVAALAAAATAAENAEGARSAESAAPTESEPSAEDLLASAASEMPRRVRDLLHFADEVLRLREAVGHRDAVFSEIDAEAMTSMLATVNSRIGKLS
ncbi:hypothetical protein [Nocardioides sp. LS1]|uniref:hypothetical protein n=1 Tax=Nocardioides sp. LS1 TaxID=1027620 RepID=UPI000F61DCDA|nr:hypothetical protein [Nocardioides sp. LS1]GCD90172.1 hypothetical protein NLS1_21780 [Nocardioides sp. LS1]